MILNEMFDNDNLPGYQSEEADNTALKLSDVRKTKLTLAQLNRLRIMNDIRKFEHEQDLSKVQQQYKPAVEAPGLM